MPVADTAPDAPPDAAADAAGTTDPAPGLDVLQVLTTTGRRGAETYAVALGERLEAHCRRIRTIALEPGPPPTLDVPALASHRRSPAGLRALRRAALDVDVVLAHGSSTLPAAALATASGGPPFVYRVIGEPGAWTTTRARRARTTALLRRAAAVAVYHRRAAEAMVALHGLDPGRVHVLAKGIDVDVWRPADDAERADARRALDLPIGAPVVAWVGAMADEKRPTLAVDAAMRVPGVQLVLAGDGPQRTLVEQVAAAHPGRVHLLGRVERTDEVFAAADAALLTSTTEGVPGAVLEAQACGVPVVSVDVGGVTEVVVDGETGRVVDAASTSLADALAGALIQVLAEPAPLGSAARRRVVSRFDLGDIADRWANLLRAITQ